MQYDIIRNSITNSLFFPFCLKDAFIIKRYFLCQKSLTITEQITITPSTCSLADFSLKVPYLIPTWISWNTLRTTFSTHSYCSVNTQQKPPRMKRNTSESSVCSLRWELIFRRRHDLKGLKQSIETFNNIIPEAESEPKKKNKNEWLYLLLREMQLPPWHGYDYKIG